MTSVPLGSASPPSLRAPQVCRVPACEKMISPVPPSRIGLTMCPRTPTRSKSAESSSRSCFIRNFTTNKKMNAAPIKPTITALTVTLIMLIAVIVGLIGAAFIFLFVVKFLMKHDRELDPADFDRVGVLGHIVSPIREGGTEEIIFSQAGTRHTCGARSDRGEALPKGTEVIVTRYEHGIAYVRKWDELAEETTTVASN